MILVILCGACAEGPVEPENPQRASPTATVPVSIHRTLDDRLSLIADSVPGFGGMFIDSSGVPNVYLLDKRQANAAQAAIQPLIDPYARAVGRKPIYRDRVKVLEARYDFRQLMTWRVTLRSLFATQNGNVVSLDIDDRNNRLSIGVVRSEDQIGLATVVSSLGIPMSAVNFVVTEREATAASLRNWTASKKGGIQIVRSSAGEGGGGECTLGFNVRYRANGEYHRGFVTASHCTDLFGGAEATNFFSPTRTSANIGEEIADPFFSSAITGCGPGDECRYSDAALISYNSDVIWAGAKIARTTYNDPISGSIDVDPANPQFTVTGSGYPTVGTVVDKVGRTTGWTWGEVQTVCIDVTAGQGKPSNYMMLCQARADAGLQGGDSGSPVFYWDGVSSVTLIGIGRGFANGQMTFSHFEDARYELGFVPWQISGF